MRVLMRLLESRAGKTGRSDTTEEDVGGDAAQPMPLFGIYVE